MLRWQHKNGRNTAYTWAHYVLISGVLHSVGAVFILFVYSDRPSHYALTMSATIQPVATVVVLAPPKTGLSTAGIASASNSVSVKQPTTRMVKQVAHKKQSAVVKKPIKKKKVVKAPPTKKQVQKLKSPAVQHKPKVKEKPIDTVNKVEKMVAPVPAVPIKALEATTPVAPVSDAIAISYTDARLMHQYAVLQNELSKRWAPPPGVADDCMCQLTVCVDRAGVVSDVVVQQSSGILIFDITARGTLLAVEWPVWAWGSSITITFKP